MGGGLKFITLWCVATLATVLIDPRWGPLLLAPLLHWALLDRAWGRPSLFLWLFYMIAIPVLVGSALNYLLVAPALQEFQMALRSNDEEAMAAANARASVWWRYAFLGTAAYTGYAVGLCYISIRTGIVFLLMVALAMGTYEFAFEWVYDFLSGGLMNAAPLNDVWKAFWVGLCGSCAIWFSRKPMRLKLRQAV